MAKITIRMSIDEDRTIRKAAAMYDLSLSEYIRYRAFDQNADLADGAKFKYLTPHDSVHNYITLNVQVKTLLTLQRLFKHHGIMSEDEFTEFDSENSNIARKILEHYQYCKIEQSKSAKHDSDESNTNTESKAGSEEDE